MSNGTRLTAGYWLQATGYWLMGAGGPWNNGPLWGYCGEGKKRDACQMYGDSNIRHAGMLIVPQSSLSFSCDAMSGTKIGGANRIDTQSGSCRAGMCMVGCRKSRSDGVRVICWQRRFLPRVFRHKKDTQLQIRRGPVSRMHR